MNTSGTALKQNEEKQARSTIKYIHIYMHVYNAYINNIDILSFVNCV